MNFDRYGKMASNETLKFEKLKGRENYQVWSRQAKSYLIIKDLWTTTASELKDSPSNSEKETDAKALAEITLMVEPYNFGPFADCNTAKAAWDSLQKAFSTGGGTRKSTLLRQLVTLKLENFDSMKDYVNSFVMTAHECKTTGLNFDEDLLANLLLSSLPSECDGLVYAIQNSKNKLTVDEVKQVLLQDDKFDRDNSGGALYTRTNNKKQFRCHICSKPGHFAKQCFQRKNKKNHDKKEKPNKGEFLMLANEHSMLATNQHSDS